MLDKRLTVRLEKYWQHIKKDEEIPDFRRNNPAMIEDMWEQCFVLSVIPPMGKAYKYEYLGVKIRKMYGGDLTGMSVDLKSKQFPNSAIVPRLQTISSLLDMKTPQECSGEMPTIDGKFIKYRTILLPFGNEKSGITHVVAGVSYREF
ncbi:MAG: PAS domain-containing protein [Rickettsiales bacterium]